MVLLGEHNILFGLSLHHTPPRTDNAFWEAAHECAGVSENCEEAARKGKPHLGRQPESCQCASRRVAGPFPMLLYLRNEFLQLPVSETIEGGVPEQS